MFKILILGLFLFAEAILAETPKCNLKLGAVLPMSGDFQIGGIEIKNGIQLGLEDFQKSEHQIEVIFEDTAYSLSRAAAATHKLVSVDNVDVVLTLWDQTEVVAPIVQKANKITIGVRWNPTVTEVGDKVFTFESTYTEWMDSLIKLLKQQNLKKIAIFTENATGWILGADYLNQVASTYGLEIVAYERLPSNTTDFRSLILKTLPKKPEVFLNFSNPPLIDLLIKQIKQFSPKQKHTGYYSVVDDRSLIEGQPLVDQLGFYPEFDRKYSEKFGKKPYARAAHGYELINILMQKLDQACHNGNVDIDQLSKEIGNLKEFQSILGPLTTSKTRNISHPNHWKISVNQEFHPYP